MTPVMAVVVAGSVTTMPLWLPLTEPLLMSVAVIDWVPTVFSVALKSLIPASPAVNV